MASAAFTESNWTGYFEITSDNTLVDEAIGVASYNLSGAPASFWSNVASDGADVRVVNSAGDTAYSFELDDFDSVAETGWVHFDSQNLLTGSDVTWRIYAGNGSATLPGNADTLGRNNVWTNYTAVFHLKEDPAGTAPQFTDSTGNGNDMDAVSMTSDQSVAGIIGNGLEFDGSTNEYAEDSDFNSLGGSADRTVSFWINSDSVTSKQHAVSLGGGATDGHRFDVGINSSNLYFETAGNVVSGTATLSSNTDYLIHMVLNGTTMNDLIGYINGSSDTLSSNSTTLNVQDGLRVGISSGGLNSRVDGVVDEVRLTSQVLSANWISTEYEIQANNGTFWTTGTWQTVSTGTSFTGSLSIGHALGLTDSASASTASAITNNQTLGMNEQARSDTAASLEQAFTLALNASSVFSFGGSFSIDIGYDNSITSQADTSGEIEGDASVTLHVAYAMTTSAKQSLLSDISIDISYASTNTASASTASTVTNDIQYVLDSLASAVASSGLTITHVSDISVGASSFTVDVTLSDGRTLSIRMQDRTEIIDSENRTLIIKP